MLYSKKMSYTLNYTDYDPDIGGVLVSGVTINGSYSGPLTITAFDGSGNTVLGIDAFAFNYQGGRKPL